MSFVRVFPVPVSVYARHVQSGSAKSLIVAENACFEKVQAYALRQEKHGTKIGTVASAEGISAEQQRGYVLWFRLCRYMRFQNRRVKREMKILRQFCRIMIITLIGEVLHWVLPLPVPASIYGMAILFAGLVTGFIKLDQVKDAGKFLIEIMPVMFIPAGVGLMSSWGDLRPVLLPVSVITVVSLVAVMVVSGKVSQHVIRLENKTEAGSLLSMEDMAAEEEAEL